jgi:hypothetical protein
MWFLLQPDGSVLMTTYGRSQKVMNVRRNPKVALLVESGTRYDELKGVLLRGQAEIVEDEALAQLDDMGELVSDSLNGDGYDHLSADQIALGPRRVGHHAVVDLGFIAGGTDRSGNQILQPDVPGDAGGPGLEAAGTSELLARQRDHDLLERRLHDVIVIGLAASEDFVERAVDDAREPPVELVRDAAVSALHRVYELLIADRRFSGRATTLNGAEPGTLGAGSVLGHDYSFNDSHQSAPWACKFREGPAPVATLRINWIIPPRYPALCGPRSRGM